MRSAQDILFEKFNPDQQDCQTHREDLRIALVLNPSLELIEEAIREAQREAIRECAEVAKACSWNDQDGLHQEVDEQSILNLLNTIQ